MPETGLAEPTADEPAATEDETRGDYMAIVRAAEVRRDADRYARARDYARRLARLFKEGGNQ